MKKNIVCPHDRRITLTLDSSEVYPDGHVQTRQQRILREL
jgi:hypothetical protein